MNQDTNSTGSEKKKTDIEQKSTVKKSHRLPLWQMIILPVASILIFFLLLEGILALFGFSPAYKTEDPFVGFASNAPLFVPVPGSETGQLMVTAPNKKDFFNKQSFSREKASNTYRIFSLGGSTTYGRPYNDTTSFSGWLRELLPTADKSKKWEIINAGGISYASYRVAHLMEELINYQPDLFIIYTGHNEFLEERTYGKLKDISPLLKTTTQLLAKTRTWSAMSDALQKLHIAPQKNKEDRVNLAAEVDSILDQSAGLDLYKRDDPLRENILKHYRISLERMVQLARSVGAQVIFVTPASNLKDFSPFKSQHTDGISRGARQRSEDLLAMSKPFVWEKNWGLVLQFLDEAVALDPRFAELLYRRGQALLGLGRYEEAKEALRRARDEDVCPLRALTPMRQIVTDVAKENGVMLVDFIDLLERRMQKTLGYSILGKEFFLDHVHPTIEGNKILAVALLQTMVSQDLVRLEPGWGVKTIASVAAKIEGGVDQEEHGRALANLARVLMWAGKNEDAARLARQALEIAGDYREVAINASTTLANAYARDNQPKLALKQIYSTLAMAPGSAELRLKLGQLLMGRHFRKLEEAAANLLLVTRLMPYYDWGHALFGIDMAERGRPQIAYPSLKEALRMNPNNSAANQKLAQINPMLRGQKLRTDPPLIQQDFYPSTAPRRLVQGRRNASGQFIPDGIDVTFYENGRLKHFVDYENGVKNGDEITWDNNGQVLTHLVYRQGVPDKNTKGQ
jgi:tetratricopeptide (TPR) repeat protein